MKIIPIEEIEYQIELISNASPLRAQKHLKIIKYLVAILADVYQELPAHTFSSEQEEINFFKNYKPQILAQLIYYKRLHAIFINEPPHIRRTMVRYYTHESDFLNMHYIKNKEFYAYVKSGDKSLDAFYYLRANNNIVNHHLEYIHYLHPHSHTSHDILLANVIAKQKLLREIESIIDNLVNQKKNVGISIFNLIWTDPKVHLVELCLLLKESKSINTGLAEFKVITAAMAEIFQIEIPGPNRAVQDIKNRIKEKFVYLEHLQKSIRDKF